MSLDGDDSELLNQEVSNLSKPVFEQLIEKEKLMKRLNNDLVRIEKNN